jgi:perosamine synthetase
MVIPQFNPDLGKQEIFSLLETIEDNWLTEGKKTAELEGMIRDYCGCKHALMVPNGTLALFAALKVLGIGPGDEVLVPDFTFFGSASAVILTGARPVLVDVSPVDFNIDTVAAEASIGPATKAIMPVHMYGQTCDMNAVMDLAKRHNLLVVEDAAQGIGVTFGDRHVGTFGQTGCISFFADKTITTGEGGVLLTNDDEIALRCRYFKNQGRLERGSFIHDQVGYNFRITDLQAAIGVVQFRRLDEIIRRKQAMYAKYRGGLFDCPQIEFPARNGWGRVVPFRMNVLAADPVGLGAYLEEHGIGVRRMFHPIHLQPCLTPENSIVRVKPVHSIRIFERGLSLPSSIDLTDEHISYVCKHIRQFVGQDTTAAKPDGLSPEGDDRHPRVRRWEFDGTSLKCRVSGRSGQVIGGTGSPRDQEFSIPST